MIAHVCATVHAECMLRKGASEKWHPPPQPQNLFVYVLLRTVLRESATESFVFHSGCSTFTPTFARGRQQMAAHRGFSFGARKC